MKNKLFPSLFLILLLGVFSFSCTTRDEAAQSDETGSISFEFDANTLISQTKAVGDSVPVNDYTLCKSTNDPLQVSIELSGVADPIVLDVKVFGGIYKTDPYELPAGTYTVNKVTVFSGSQVYYSGVYPGGLLSKFVPVPATGSYLMGQQQFTLLKWTKPTIKLYVLCAKGFNATDFGMPKFEINRIEVTCFDIFVNVCDLNNEHIVGEGTVYLIPFGTPLVGSVPDYSKALYKDNFNGGTIVNGQPTTEGDIATLCFPDNLQIPDNQEKYDLVFVINNSTGQKIFTQTVTVENLKKFKESDLWDPSMNAIHVEYCGGVPFCIIPNDDCGGTTTDGCDPFMPTNSGLENFNSYNTKANLQNAWPWTIKNTALISVIGLQATANVDTDDYVYVKGNQQGEVTWESKKFVFTKGNKITLKASIRKLNGADQPGEPGGNSFDAWLKIQLVDQNGNKVGTEMKQKMQSKADFSYTNYEFIRKNIGTGCYKMQITLDMQSGSKERFDFRMDDVRVGN
ncbi:MAG: hypothetical protein ACRCZQ_02710 [Bacteroidales bacterium]